ncbi:glucans biosynthesis glucosyltransferase MdoH [Humitalea sp. 24SJ18S-53]|uniref:glucans biosynthesis glucosyltransferase MdoH n=1 Tax=Humitalea sp. 24SJ18S-53 TaxID=3422307 RepID=UPI003D677EAD
MPAPTMMMSASIRGCWHAARRLSCYALSGITAAMPHRLIFAALALTITALLLGLLWRAIAPGGVTVWEWLILVAYVGTVPWSAISAGNALLGFCILMGSRDPPAAVVPQLSRARETDVPGVKTAILVCIRNEDMAAVLPPLATLLDGLEAAGAGEAFVLWFASDTQNPAAALAEATAIATFCHARSGRPIPVEYRRRAENTGFKAGNVMDWCDHHGMGLEAFICLDADSAMSARAVLRLVSCLEADPRLAILQQLITGRPAVAPFPRLFQFGMRAGMRSWATGQGWWQGDEGPYWGHNAIIRIAPFRTHGRLETLPDGSHILSHDQVEAVRLHAAGWKVRCLPDEDGSQEGNPPAMPEFLGRDQRWAAGNMQYFALLRLPGLTAMGRWQLWQAILLFFGAPLWLLLLLAATMNVVTGGGAATPSGALAAVMVATWLCYFSPKLMGYLQVLLQPVQAARYGGRRRFAAGALAEIGFTTLFEPPSVLNKAIFLLLLPFGRRGGWAPQNRADRGVTWGDAWRLLWPHTLLGLVLAVALGPAVVWAVPFLAGLWLAVPLCVVTASPTLAAWMQARRLCAVPEELGR